LYYFKTDTVPGNFVDYIEKNINLSAEVCLVIVPEEAAQTGRLQNCKRFTAKTNFSVEWLNDTDGTVLYFREPEAPGPFMMLVQYNDV
jgi:hypothetical protein